MDEPSTPPPPDRPRDEVRPVAPSGTFAERAGPTVPGGTAPAAEAGEPEPWTLRRIVHAKPFVPTVVVVGLVCVVLLSSRLAGRPPVVDVIATTSASTPA